MFKYLALISLLTLSGSAFAMESMRDKLARARAITSEIEKIVTFETKQEEAAIRVTLVCQESPNENRCASARKHLDHIRLRLNELKKSQENYQESIDKERSKPLIPSDITHIRGEKLTEREKRENDSMDEAKYEVERAIIPQPTWFYNTCTAAYSSSILYRFFRFKFPFTPPYSPCSQVASEINLASKINHLAKKTVIDVEITNMQVCMANSLFPFLKKCQKEFVPRNEQVALKVLERAHGLSENRRL